MFRNKRLRTPTILQMEAIECGAAALGIVLGYFGRFIPLEKLRVECGISRDGSKALNMLKVARSYGLKADAAKIEDLETLKSINKPLILFWQFNHFVVLEGYNSGKFYINDPATGPRTVDEKTFDQSFTGVALIAEPTADFQKGGKRDYLRRNIYKYWPYFKKPLIFLMFVSLALVVPGILIPMFSKIFIDEILILNQHAWLIPLAWGMLLTAIFRGILSWLQQKYLLHSQLEMFAKTGMSLFYRILRLPIQFFQQRYTGDIAERISANNRIAELLTGGISLNAVNLISILFFAIVMILLSPILASFTILGAFINLSLLYFLSRKIADINLRFLQDRGRLTGIEMNALQVIETIKSMGWENYFFAHWAGYHAKTINSQRELIKFQQLFTFVPQLSSGLLIVIILGVGGLEIMHGDLTIGTLVAFQSLFMSFNAPLTGLINLGTQLQQIRGDFTRINDIYNYPQDARLDIKEENPITWGKVVLKNITFGYSHVDPALIQNVNMVIEPGSHIAIVGRTGSGKSTLAKLMAGFYQPWTGEILIDDLPINKISAADLAQSLALVDPDIFLFEGTLYDNLSLWQQDIPITILENALNTAKAEDILREKGGLNGRINEGGSNLSGGQKQRLEIARALINQPKILILDEATSALDSIIENHIYAGLHSLGITLITIAHRLSTIRKADYIYVLQEGQITQQGHYQDLQGTHGFFNLINDSSSMD